MSHGISSENERFLDSAVTLGLFGSRGEAIDHAVAMLRERSAAVERIRSQPIPLPELPSLLEKRPDGALYVTGRRISLQIILLSYFSGEDSKAIRQEFPSLTLAEVEQIVDFIDQNRAAMEAYLAQQQQLENLILDQAHRGPSLKELRERWQSKYGSGS
jgi:uncharacterized protein (DUF433 family)